MIPPFAADQLGPLEFSLIAMGLLGGVALFLFGMDLMTESLTTIAGGGMRRLLARLTGNRFLAVVTGALITALFQSSTVTTVMVVGFVSAGIMSLTQSVGVIMGANIGSTVTAQIIAFQVTRLAMLLLFTGFVLRSVSRYDRTRHLGSFLLGLGMIFLAMDLMSGATAPLRTYPPFIDLMARMDNPFLAVLVGAAFTALVQSSAATTGILIVLASQGFVTLEGAIAVTLGANIGTCLTAGIAAIGKPPEAVRAATIHVLFNVIGVLLWIGLVPQLAELARWVSPSRPDLEGLARIAAEAPRQVANAHTVFNVANTLVLIWFAGPLARLAVWAAPAWPGDREVGAQPKYLDASYLATPALALDRVQLELSRLGGKVAAMLEAMPEAVFRGSRERLDRLQKMDDEVDALQRAIIDYLRRIDRNQLAAAEIRRSQMLLQAAVYLENVGDLIETNLVELGRDRVRHRLEISDATRRAIETLADEVLTALRLALAALSENDAAAARAAIGMKRRVDQLSDAALERIADRLIADEPNRVTAFRVETDIVGQCKRIYYLAKRLAKLIAGEEGDGDE